MRNIDFTYFLRASDSEIKTPIRIYLFGHSLNCDRMKQLITRLQTCPHPVDLHFSNSGITEQSAILLAESLCTFKHAPTLYFSRTDIQKSGRCISVFTSIANRHAFPIGTRIIGLTNYITETCNLHLTVFYTKVLFSLSPYKNTTENKTGKRFPHDVTQVILGFLTVIPLDIAFLDIAFTVRKKIDEEHKNKNTSCALS